VSILIVQLGSPRKARRGFAARHGEASSRVAFRSPTFARLDYYDVWFPNLSPSAELVQKALGGERARMDSIQAEVPARDEPARSKPGTGRPGGTFASHKSLARLLLRGREPLPPVHIAGTIGAARRGHRLKPSEKTTLRSCTREIGQVRLSRSMRESSAGFITSLIPGL